MLFIFCSYSYIEVFREKCFNVASSHKNSARPNNEPKPEKVDTTPLLSISNIPYSPPFESIEQPVFQPHFANYYAKPSTKSDRHFVRMRGLPWNCTECDVETFFKGIEANLIEKSPESLLNYFQLVDLFLDSIFLRFVEHFFIHCFH